MIISLNHNSDISVALVFWTRDEIRLKHLQMKTSCLILIILFFSKNKVTNESFARQPFQFKRRATCMFAEAHNNVERE